MLSQSSVYPYYFSAVIQRPISKRYVFTSIFRLLTKLKSLQTVVLGVRIQENHTCVDRTHSRNELHEFVTRCVIPPGNRQVMCYFFPYSSYDGCTSEIENNSHRLCVKSLWSKLLIPVKSVVPIKSCTYPRYSLCV